jgi:hypothetical protein
MSDQQLVYLGILIGCVGMILILMLNWPSG